MQSPRRNPSGRVGTAGWDERNLVEENQPCGSAVVYKNPGRCSRGLRGTGERSNMGRRSPALSSSRPSKRKAPNANKVGKVINRG